ncbi:MAG: peptidyl-alpha-hydroxyglycine alpha-amidating lyase family protein [Candidatus Limnocylindrales bacterium]
MIGGEGSYGVVDGWERPPSGIVHRDVPGVAIDRDDNVYLITRGDARVLIYAQDGTFIRSWGESRFSAIAHGITIGPDGAVWCTDVLRHVVEQFSQQGSLRLTLGTGSPSDTGHDGRTIASIGRAGPPFNRPTNVAIASSGDVYATDGYGNARVHQFTPDGVLVRSWGGPGTGPGEFALPHGIAVHRDGRVFVADRENDRVQVFDLAGTLLDIWDAVQRPTQIVCGPEGLLYISHLGWAKGERSPLHGLVPDDRPGHVSIRDDRGRPVTRWDDPPGGGPRFAAPHGLAVDSRGDIYVAEVPYSFGIRTGDPPTLRKFARIH